MKITYTKQDINDVVQAIKLFETSKDLEATQLAEAILMSITGCNSFQKVIGIKLVDSQDEFKDVPPIYYWFTFDYTTYIRRELWKLGYQIAWVSTKKDYKIYSYGKGV